jgi:hypothetical protein
MFVTFPYCNVLILEIVVNCTGTISRECLLIGITSIGVLNNLQLYILSYRSWDIAFGIVTGYGLDDQEIGVQVPIGSRIFTSMSSRPAVGSTQPPTQWVLQALSQG